MADILSILDDYGVEYRLAGQHHHATQNFAQVNCCFCSSDEGFRMGIALSGSHASCWRCGPHSIIDTFKELLGLSYKQVKELLADIAPDIQTPVKHRGKLVLPKGIKPLNDLPAHKRYLRGRGYNWRELARLWGVQGLGIAPEYAWRVFIPIHYHGEIVSWTTRTISDNPDTLRYISASPEEEILDHKTLLYGEDYARHAIAIQEGPTGVWRIGPGAVATLGTGFKQAQVLRMSKYPVRAVCFDAEQEAQKRAKKLVDALSVFPGETYNVQWETGKDAGEASEKEIAQLRKKILT